MSIYLVLLRHDMDDLPVYMTFDREEAMDVARTLDWEPDQRVLEVFGIRCNTPNLIDVVRFEGGRPVELICVRDYGDEQP